MLLSNRCLLARVQPQPARPSEARAAGGRETEEEKTAFTVLCWDVEIGERLSSENANKEKLQ